MRYDAGNALKDQGNWGELTALPLNSMECGIKKQNFIDFILRSKGYRSSGISKDQGNNFEGILKFSVENLGEKFKEMFDNHKLYRACRRIHEEVIQTSYSSFPLFFSLRFRSLSLIPISYLVKSTKSRMNLFRLNDKIDLGPAISSVCQRRSFGLLNL